MDLIPSIAKIFSYVVQHERQVIGSSFSNECDIKVNVATMRKNHTSRGFLPEVNITLIMNLTNKVFLTSVKLHENTIGLFSNLNK